MPIVAKPNEQEFVFVKFEKDYDRYLLNTQIELIIKKNNIYFLPYSAIK